ncbi:MAG: FAD-dependent monooxygenase [Bacteroidetes bacterium]|nr:FAD-dependent monooxygenase [Bacteroidota bacterium]MBS1539958.1 FAD-dependent monooxygenase [Bacteroidota bacterium]
MRSHKHIAIAGAGLVGSLLAIYLAKRGYRVSVFERRTDMRKVTADRGRSINLALSNRGLRALEEVGLADEIRRVAIPMHGRTMHSVSGNLSFQPYGKQGQFINSISRSNLNVVLMNKAESLGVQFYFEKRVASVDFEKTALHFQSPDDTPMMFDAIIGADGGFSAVRGAMQVTDRFNYSQHYIEHGYKELTIPPAEDGFQLEKNSLHIWPRESYMLIALPNIDGSFTCTLFFPFEGKLSFDTLRTPDEVRSFFQQQFPDACQLMPTLVDDFCNNPTASLVTVKCFPWVKNKILLMGDAAHAIVPFFGQGMNAGFEDCRVLNHLLDKNADQLENTFAAFQTERKQHTDAIAQLALDNFIEMRDLVGDEKFLLRKKIEAKLHELYPEKWIPLYSMVTFYEDTGYADALSTGQRQKQIMDEVMQTPDIKTNWPSLDFEKIVSKL